MLLESPDTPTLVESTRLLLTVVSAGEAGSPWREDVKTKPDINRALAFILNSSTNGKLQLKVSGYVFTRHVCLHDTYSRQRSIMLSTEPLWDFCFIFEPIDFFLAKKFKVYTNFLPYFHHKSA